jgi:uncharacterized protein (TIGR03437 family)
MIAIVAIQRTGRVWVVLAGLALTGSISAQTLGNQTLSGRYFFRHVSLGTDAAGKLTDPRSLIGTLTFDSTGHYSYTGQQVQGNNAAAAASGSGAYSVDPAGFVSLDNPQRSGAKVNARYGSEALVGSTTETSDNTFDLFVAIRAPSTGASLGGPYWVVTLEFPGASTANMRNTIFSLTAGAGGTFSNFSANGHAANLSAGAPFTQPVTGATYTMAADGTGSAFFGGASNLALVSGNRTLYVSADGNMILGGSTAAGGHDILIGVKAVTGASNATWNGDFWGASLRFDANGLTGFVGSATTRGTGKLIWTKRQKAFGQPNLDLTEINSYVLRSDGSGAMELTQMALGAGLKGFEGSSVDPQDPNAYELYLGVLMPSLSKSGVFVNPLGISNAASYAPAGNPISPGEFINIYGTGFANATLSATPPYPPTLGGMTVLINNKSAPIYFVSPTRVIALVPYSTQGPTATIVVQSGGSSSTATVPVAATTPGIFTLDQSGSGLGAILHTDFTVVDTSHPATSGETVLIFLTGMGAVTPAVADGTAGGGNPPSNTNAKPTVLAGGLAATVSFSGLAPGFPGLYQINAALPVFASIGSTGTVPLAIQVGNSFHDQVDLAVR